MSLELLNRIWPEWTVEKQLGKGSYGTVYQAVRTDHNVRSCAAIKVISIPQDPSELDSLRSEGLGLNGTRTYLQELVNDFVGEIQLMESLKGVQNIVSVEDYKVVEKTQALGWDILIRMELLTPFNTYAGERILPEDEVIRLGIDICSALQICGRRNIIHRDIKPENIFVNDFGFFKLGDFGIARKLENASGGLSQKGTFNYMAPEVANGSIYDGRADLYSLGIVLYKLLNRNRLPFLDSEQQLLSPNAHQLAVQRRLRGEPLSAPCEASPAMRALILKACAFDPAQRFASASEMKRALEAVRSGAFVSIPDDPDATTTVRHAGTGLDGTDAASADQQDTFGKKKRKAPAVLAVAAALALLIGAAVFAPKLTHRAEDEAELLKTAELPNEKAEAAPQTSGEKAVLVPAEAAQAPAQAPAQTPLPEAPAEEAPQTPAEPIAPAQDPSAPTQEAELRVSRLYADVDPETEVARIREVYLQDANAILAGSYSARLLRPGVTVFRNGQGELRGIYVFDDSAYGRYFYFDNGELYFAYLEGRDAHRLYYYSGELMRWRYCADAEKKDDAVNRDWENSEEFLSFGQRIKDEATGLFLEASAE